MRTDVEQGSLIHFYTQGTRSGIGGLWVICWLDEAHSLGWRGHVRKTSCPCGVGGETGYTAQGNLKSVNSDNMGEGRVIRIYFFCSCIPRPSLVLSTLSSVGHHIYLVTMNFKINSVFKNYNWFLQISLNMLLFGAFLLAHLVKNPLAMQETLVWFLGWEVYLEKR